MVLPLRERLAAGGLRGAELLGLVESALGVDCVEVEVGDVERGRAREDERAHRGGVGLQVDLRRRCAVGAADEVELPVTERGAHRVQVVHRHPRPVLSRVPALRVRSPGPALVDEQDVAERVQRARLPTLGERLLRGGVSRPAREISDRVLPGGLQECRQNDHIERDRAPRSLRPVLRTMNGPQRASIPRTTHGLGGHDCCA
jgi:hypothetical protein